MGTAPGAGVDAVVYTLDPHGQITSWNEHAEQVYGYRAEEVIGLHVSLLQGGAERVGPDIRADALTIAGHSGRYQAEVRRRHKNGSQFEARILVQPLRGASGVLIGFTETLSPTSPESSECELPPRLKAFMESYRQFEHEHNNALFSIMGGIELLRWRMPADDSAGNALFDLVKRHLDKIKNLVPPFETELNGQPPKSTKDGNDMSDAEPSATAMTGLRVLLVEDESLVRMLIEDYLNQLDCKLVGFASTVEKGLAMAASGDIDIALLDWNLQGKPVEPVALELAKRGVPFVFISGSMTASWNSRPTIRKPFDVDTLRREMARAISGARGAVGG